MNRAKRILRVVYILMGLIPYGWLMPMVVNCYMGFRKLGHIPMYGDDTNVALFMPYGSTWNEIFFTGGMFGMLVFPMFWLIHFIASFFTPIGKPSIWFLLATYSGYILFFLAFYTPYFAGFLAWYLD